MRRSGLSVGAIVLFLVTLAAPLWAQATASSKLGPLARGRSLLSTGSSRVIVRTDDPQGTSALSDVIVQAGARPERLLPIINGWVANVPNAALAGLAHNPLVAHIAADRLVFGSLERTGAAIGATTVRQETGLDGSGIGCGRDRFRRDRMARRPDGRGRSSACSDSWTSLTGGRTPTTITATARTSPGSSRATGSTRAAREAGLRPGPICWCSRRWTRRAAGRISDVIAALDYIVANKDTLHIRVVNLSVSAGVYESYNQIRSLSRRKRAVDAGIVVVAAAGNAGRDAHGVPLYGGTTAPGNAPWVVTVGTSNHQGTTERSDDTVAAFSSRGPAAVDYAAKPDLVAPGVETESLSAPGSLLYTDEVGVPARRHGA